MTFASLGLPPGAIDIPVINASTGTCNIYGVVVGGIRVPHTWSLPAGVDPTDGKFIIPAAPSTTAEASEVLGVAQEVIPPLSTGMIRVFGASFVRIGTGLSANTNQALTSTTTAGCATGTTAVNAVFCYAVLTAAMTFTFGSKVYTFTTTHAYGFVNALPQCMRLR